MCVTALGTRGTRHWALDCWMWRARDHVIGGLKRAEVKRYMYADVIIAIAVVTPDFANSNCGMENRGIAECVAPHELA